MRFGPHSVSSVEEAQEMHDRLKNDFKDVFKKGDKNIFFAENATYVPGLQENIQVGLAKYRSVKKSAAYAALRHLGKDPTDEEIGKIVRNFENAILDDTAEPIDRSSCVLYQVLDELIEEGYEFRMIFELGDEVGSKSEQLYTKPYPNSHKRFKARELDMLRRDRRAANQIRAVFDMAQSKGLSVNMYALFGTFHSWMGEMVADFVTPEVRLDTEEAVPLEQARRRIRAGKRVTRKMWREVDDWRVSQRLHK